MRIETLIGLSNQLTIKTLSADSRLIARYQQNCLSSRVERKGNTPFAIGRAETKLLHVCVARTVERIHARAPQLRPKLRKQSRQRQNLILDLFGESVELLLEYIPDLYVPNHQL